MPSVTFSSLGVPEDVANALAARGIAAPFPIQVAALPDALAGRDVCGKAPTGSGKTIAFGLPLVLRAGTASPRRPKALVLAPTRELAAQIATELEKLSAGRRCSVATFYGGVGFGAQLNALRRGVDIAVACPGRLDDLIGRGEIHLEDVSMVVIDEADRMADMGFMPVVRRLLDQVRPERQTLLFSATLDGDVAKLIKRYQNKPAMHELETSEQDMGELEHLFWKADRNDRLPITARIVLAHDSAMVFCRTRHGVDRLTKQLARAGVAAAPIHGDRSQAQRDRALAAFKAGRVRVLVGTDVAARGIHVEGVGCVVHFDPPEDEKAYVHRSGRTGRAGASGTVISLVAPEHSSVVRALQARLGFERRLAAPDQSFMVSLETFREHEATPVEEPPPSELRPVAARGFGGRPERARTGRRPHAAASGRAQVDRGSGRRVPSAASEGQSQNSGGQFGRGQHGSSAPRGGARRSQGFQGASRNGGSAPARNASADRRQRPAS